MDVAKSIDMLILMNLLMTLVIFMAFHLSKPQQKMNLNFKKDYI